MSDVANWQNHAHWKRHLVVGGGLGLVGLLFGFWIGTRSQPVTPPPPIQESAQEKLIELSLETQRSADLKITEVVERPLERTLVATGVLAPDQNRLAHIGPLARGVVEQVLAQIGDRVRVDDPLLIYDNIELGVLIGEYLVIKAEIKREQAQAEVAKRYLARAEALLMEEAIARREYELRDAQYK